MSTQKRDAALLAVLTETRYKIHLYPSLSQTSSFPLPPAPWLVILPTRIRETFHMAGSSNITSSLYLPLPDHRLTLIIFLQLQAMVRHLLIRLAKHPHLVQVLREHARATPALKLATSPRPLCTPARSPSLRSLDVSISPATGVWRLSTLLWRCSPGLLPSGSIRRRSVLCPSRLSAT